jgi:probable rRNA maturation factor
VPVPERWLVLLESVAPRAVELAMTLAADPDAPLFHLATIDVALVDDPTSARVHLDFMDLPGATDVITFHHGEIVIGAEVALRQAAEFGEPLPRELLRYLVHGLLHLAGHEDHHPAARARMEQAQETIIGTLDKGSDLTW